ncbi:hypothetical protein [Pedobacter nototheniae]|nr:hypothetical protein [Pedobacter nototheniae]
MKIATLVDYQDAVKTLNCLQQIKNHDVLVLNKTEKNNIANPETIS